jgi:hypothetical protein
MDATNSLAGTRFGRIGMAAAALAAVSGMALGQTNTVYNFENLTAGTSVTTQYRGVTINRVLPPSGTLSACVIATESNSASPTRVLRAPFAGEEFSPHFMRLSFTQPQRFVQFAMGPSNIFCIAPLNRMRVTAFNAGGTVLFTRDYSVNVTGANTLVQVGSETGPFEIARIEVNGTILGFCSEQGESIDDLTFLPDTTPPVVTITAPADDACVCGNAPVVISGSVCDPDGIYLGDRLEYSTQPDGPWTFVINATGPLCAGGTLYNWDTASLPGGHYYLRITGTNADGWSTSEVRRVFVDKTPPAINLRTPSDASPTPIYSGQVCFDGSVGGEGCANPTWQLQWRPGASGTWNNIGTPQTSSITNDPLGTWNVSSLADGAYQVRITASDQCSLTAELPPRNVIVDNTPPTAIISDPLNCANVGGNVIIRGTAFDANISGWSLQVVGGPWNTWQPIASGTGNIVNGVLGVFATGSRPQCEYAVRLIVNDRSLVGCGGGVQSREFVTTIGVSQPGECDDIDFNNDGSVFDPADIDAFLRVFSEGPCVD